MLAPIPHDPRPGAPAPLVHTRQACALWTAAALMQMRDAEDARRAAINNGDDPDPHTNRVLDARSVFMEFNL